MGLVPLYQASSDARSVGTAAHHSNAGHPSHVPLVCALGVLVVLQPFVTNRRLTHVSYPFFLQCWCSGEWSVSQGPGLARSTRHGPPIISNLFCRRGQKGQRSTFAESELPFTSAAKLNNPRRSFVQKGGKRRNITDDSALMGETHNLLGVCEDFCSGRMHVTRSFSE